MNKAKAEFLENWKPSYMGGGQWLHLADARRRFESDLDALLKEEAGKLIKHLKGMHPYPEDIFIPPTKEQFEQTHRVLKDAGLSSDRFAGHACRIGYNACIFNIEQLNN